ncbi:DUF3467 domain-containing protein [Candidatus Daviesbacteria bacterium]|nr:DUF3467 domain-containing protein [Candidatus Daviesbacteria bacterium]
MAKATDEKLPTLTINAGTVIGSNYSQYVGVTITDIDVTLEFVYINPRIDPEKRATGQVVSRITLSHSTAEELSKVITDTIKEHNAKKEKKDG